MNKYSDGEVVGLIIPTISYCRIGCCHQNPTGPLCAHTLYEFQNFMLVTGD